MEISIKVEIFSTRFQASRQRKDEKPRKNDWWCVVVMINHPDPWATCNCQIADTMPNTPIEFFWLITIVIPSCGRNRGVWGPLPLLKFQTAFLSFPMHPLPTLPQYINYCIYSMFSVIRFFSILDTTPSPEWATNAGKQLGECRNQIYVKPKLPK